MTVIESHYSRYSNPLDDEVKALKVKYRSIGELSHALRYIRDSPKPSLYETFCDLISRHIDMILNRPQAINDGHITIYDRSLLELSRNGSKIHSVPVQELYLREFMGFDENSCLSRDTKMLEQDLYLRGALLKSSASTSFDQPQSYHLQGSANGKANTSTETAHSEITPSQNLPFSETRFDSYKISWLTRDPTISSNIQRMLRTYFQAKNDFYARLEFGYADVDDSSKNADAAKFLRDSAENVLSYLQAQDLIASLRVDDECHGLVMELETVFAFAKTKAIDFLGGRKRRFEVENRYKGASSTGNGGLNKLDCGKRRFGGDRYVGKYENHLWHPYERTRSRQR